MISDACMPTLHTISTALLYWPDTPSPSALFSQKIIMKFSALVIALMAGSAAAFMPAVAPTKFALKPTQAALKGGGDKEGAMFSSAMDKFKADYPGFAAKGWGPSAKAERWNGRHAMFGWAMIIGTAQVR